MLGVGCVRIGARTTTARLPDLRASADGCVEPEPSTPMRIDSTIAVAPNTLSILVRSAQVEGPRAFSVRVIGPIHGAWTDHRLGSEGERVRLSNLAPGRYVVQARSLGHHVRVDTLDVSASGRSVLLVLDRTPSHWCGAGQLIVPPRRTSRSTAPPA